MRLVDLNVEMLGVVLEYLEGGILGKVSIVSKWFYEEVVTEDDWRKKVEVTCVKKEQADEKWRDTYIKYCHKPESWTIWWKCRSVNHGLGDRVAQPQLFCSKNGRYLFCYGGWTRRGPTNELNYVEMDQVRSHMQREKRTALQEEDFFDESSDFHFLSATTSGVPCIPRGVQTLTPLWEDKEEKSYVMAMGGAGGGYANETDDWRIGFINDEQLPPSIQWLESSKTRPQRRGAHTATYVPPFGNKYKKGAVFVFGGHTAECSYSLNSIDIFDIMTWEWEQDVQIQNNEQIKPRHGHSATLAQVDSKYYIIFIGGGIGNILHGFGQHVSEYSDALVLDVENMSWLTPSIQLNITFGRHHSASRCLGNQILLFGGGARPRNISALVDTAALVRIALKQKKEQKKVQKSMILPFLNPLGRAIPRGRKMHAACCLMPWLSALCIFGGWEFGPHFDDFWIGQLLTTSIDRNQAALALDNSAAEDAVQNDEQNYHRHEEDIITVTIETDTGVHQVNIPRFIFNRFVAEGVLTAGPATLNNLDNNNDDMMILTTEDGSEPDDQEVDGDDALPIAGGEHYHRLFCGTSGDSSDDEHM